MNLAEAFGPKITEIKKVCLIRGSVSKQKIEAKIRYQVYDFVELSNGVTLKNLHVREEHEEVIVSNIENGTYTDLYVLIGKNDSHLMGGLTSYGKLRIDQRYTHPAWLVGFLGIIGSVGVAWFAYSFYNFKSDLWPVVFPVIALCVWCSIKLSQRMMRHVKTAPVFRAEIERLDNKYRQRVTEHFETDTEKRKERETVYDLKTK